MISRYLCAVIGEDPDVLRRQHASTIRRQKAFAIAIHIPVVIWAFTGFLISVSVFEMTTTTAALTSAGFASLVYLVERLVLTTPTGWFVSAVRLLIGVVIAMLGATSVDLVIFQKEVAQELRASEADRLASDFDVALEHQHQKVEHAKEDWLRAREAANCEANGTCGSRVRSVGPVYKELARQAETLREDYVAAQSKAQALAAERSQAVEELRGSDKAIKEAGLLARVQALHSYIRSNHAAFVAWALFFTLMLLMELLVIMTKIGFGSTVDDHLESIREQLSRSKANAYLEAVTSPVASARQLLDAPS